MRRLCADTGFMFALYDDADSRNETAQEYFVSYFENGDGILVLPWPVMYESLNTLFASNTKCIKRLKQDFRILNGAGRLELQDDVAYRDRALAVCLEEPGLIRKTARTLSLVDRTLREMLLDPNLNLGGVLTNDPKAFTDVCRKARKEMILL